MNDSDDLLKILNNAGEATSPPPPPAPGIPKQWVPGWIRWPIRAIFLPFIVLDSAMKKVARKIIRPPFKKEGQCKRRGNCCYYILMKRSKRFMHFIDRFWNTQINGFYVRDPEPKQLDDKEVFVMGCRYLKKDGSCAHYHLRPVICREYPVIEHFGAPKILKGCGYKVSCKDKKYEVYYEEE